MSLILICVTKNSEKPLIKGILNLQVMQLSHLYALAMRFFTSRFQFI